MGVIMTKQDIKKYYQSLKDINMLKDKIIKLKEQKQKIIDSINNDDFILNSELQAVSYEITGVNNSVCRSSPQDRQIEKAYKELEKQYQKITLEILQTEMLVDELQDSNFEFEFFLTDLVDEDKKIIELFFEKGKSALQIGLDLSMDRTTVAKRINKVIKRYNERYQGYFDYMKKSPL